MTELAVAGDYAGNRANDDDEGYKVSRLRRMYHDFVGAKRDEIEEQRISRHYYHADQWTSAEVAVLRKRRQPVITLNRIARKIDGVVGFIERMRQDPKAYPRTPQHEKGAEVSTAALRFVLDNADWPSLSPEAGRTGAVNGISGVELFLEKGDNGDPDVGMAPVDPDTFFYDPRSVREDFSDARYMGVAKWVSLDVAQDMFPEHKDTLSSLVSTGSNIETWQQQDREKRWIDIDEKRVFLVEHWYMKGKEWHWCFYVADVKLRSGVSPFSDENGETFCRYVMFSAYVDHDGDRYGFVRNMKSAQDEINARRSKALHQLNTRRIITEEGAVNDIEKTRVEAARPDGVIVLNPSEGPLKHRFEFDDAAKQADMAGQLAFLEEAKSEIENYGPTMVDKGGEARSGRAIALLQQQGLSELGPFIIAYKGWKIRIYRACWNIIQQHWQAERWVRVTDDEGVAEFIGLNHMGTDDEGFPLMQNQISALDVDIIIDEGPDVINTQAEMFEIITSMGPNVPWQVVVELAPIDSQLKKKLLDNYAQQQAPDPMAEQKGQLELEDAQATIAGKKAKGIRDFAAATKDIADAMQPKPPPMMRPQEGMMQ